MSNPSGAKGSLFERQFVEWLRVNQMEAERLRTAGALDEGDAWARGLRYHLFEAKATRSIDLATGFKELEKEWPRFAKRRLISEDNVDPWLVVKRRNHGIGQSYMVTTPELYFRVPR
jgi:Holliday junction resolvase